MKEGGKKVQGDRRKSIAEKGKKDVEGKEEKTIKRERAEKSGRRKLKSR